MSQTMLALRYEQCAADPVLRQVPVPSAPAGGVVIDVLAAGLCHSDVHVVDAPAGAMAFEPGFTLGHEAAGRVSQVGEGVDPSWLGRDVVVHGVWGCGRCTRCAAGRENYCLELGGRIGCGLGFDGAMAEKMAVPSVRHLLDATGLDPLMAAPLTDAALTAWHAISQCGPAIGVGARVLVIGVGGLGHVAVQLLVRAGCQVTAADTVTGARELAQRLGAAQVCASTQDASAAGPFDVVMDFVGAQSTLDAALADLAPGGVVALVGGAGGQAVVGKKVGLAPGWTVTAPFWGSHAELGHVVQAAREGQIHTEVQVFSLADALQAFAALRAGQIRGRAVIMP